MCGIVGFHGKGDAETLKEVTNGLSHRGPDGSGYAFDDEKSLYLGHRRLAVVDIQDGHQPLWSADRKLCVIYNGEIYNAPELRRELERYGYTFLTDHSDTEVLIHGYRHWGEALPEKLNGMFAFAIWDVEKQSLFLARDRFGEKPLYWGRQGDLFLFGSELRVFKTHPEFHVEIDSLGLKKYLAYGFIPAPYTFYKNVQKLSAGHRIWYNLATQDVELSTYWAYEIQRDTIAPSIEEASEQFLELLRGAVKRRMVSDVPLGVFLSGGIDSSSVAALACELSPEEKVRTFSIGFDDASYDESAYASEMATFLGTNHTTEVFDLKRLMTMTAEVLGKLDEPMADPSLLPTFALSQMTRKHVTVALSGDGGDELLAGYDTFQALNVAQSLEKLMPNCVRSPMLRLIDLLPKSQKNMSFDYKLARALGGIGHGASVWHPQWLAPASLEMINDLLNEPTSREELYQDAISHWEKCQSTSLVDRASEYYVRFYLQDNILTKVDRASMLNSLETRAVFLDTQLVDYIQTLPADLKYRNKVRKFILKEAVKKVIPESILNRPKKGFGIPLAEWAKELSLDVSRLEELGLCSGPATLWRTKHISNKKDYRLFLWAWYVLNQFRGMP
ncbi:asparagine synthase (glutamine-hydrolyzing) [Terasakiella pusilla]|uniref:asparagine synthase (glutamine-hydrolyzing) n=1 Tax=Terasakiella pusilla TaxID=64973 RepID=UPI003AA7D5C3